MDRRNRKGQSLIETIAVLAAISTFFLLLEKFHGEAKPKFNHYKINQPTGTR